MKQLLEDRAARRALRAAWQIAYQDMRAALAAGIEPDWARLLTLYGAKAYQAARGRLLRGSGRRSRSDADGAPAGTA